MEPWGWILVYLVGFVLFQLVVFRYFGDGSTFGGVSLESGETAGPQTIDSGRTAREPSKDPEPTTDGVRCSHCGTDNQNQQPFRYCRNCLAQLR
jgi:ribosomal protein S14